MDDRILEEEAARLTSLPPLVIQPGVLSQHGPQVEGWSPALEGLEASLSCISISKAGLQESPTASYHQHSTLTRWWKQFWCQPPAAT